MRDAQATLILARGALRGARDALRGGTALTEQWARALGRPLCVVDPDDPAAAEAVLAWLAEEAIERLNVAGPRESQQPGIYAASRRLLEAVLRPAGDAPG